MLIGQTTDIPVITAWSSYIPGEPTGSISILSSNTEPSVGKISDLSSGLIRNGAVYSDGDLDLVNGHVQLSESDVVLSGLGMMDMSISRRYSSQFYNSTANPSVTADAQWGGWIGQGWQLNIAMRAIIVQSSVTGNRVIIQSGGASDEYLELNGGRSTNPLNQAIATIEFDGTCTLRQPNGFLYHFTRLMSQDHREYMKVFPPGVYGIAVNSVNKLSVYYLTKITDPHGNFVQLDYETVKSGQEEVTTANNWNLSRPLESIIGRGIYEVIENDESAVSWKTRRLTNYFLRPISMTDKLGRRVDFLYDHLTPISPYSVTGLRYINSNGVSTQVKYRYDSAGRLIESRLGDLPPTTYSYSEFVNRFHLYFIPIVGYSNNKYYELYTSAMEGNGYALNSRAIKISDQDSKFDRYRGFLLSAVNAGLGGRVEYEYTQTLSSTIVDNHGISKTRNSYGSMAISGVLYQTANPSGTGPVVVGKKVFADGEINQYTIQYPLKGSTGLISKARYKKDGVLGFSFESVSVIRPKGMPVGEFRFQNGLCISVKEGIMETKSEWDFDKQLQKKSTNLINGMIQSEIETLTWDSKRNPTQIITRKGTTDWIKQEIVYSTNFNHISNNILNLPIKITRYPVSDLSQKRVQQITYSSQGLPLEIYEGEAGSSRLIKKMTYDSSGRPIEQRSPAPFGEQIVTTRYDDTGSKIIVTTTKSGKSAVAELAKSTGQILRKIDLNGAITTYEYDDYGRPTKVTAPNGAVKTMAYSTDLKTTTTVAGGLTSRIQVDGLGRTVWIDNPSGQDDVSYTYYFGSAVDAISVGQMSGDTLLGATVKKRYTYDNKLRKTSVTTDFGTITYTYDDINRKTRSTDPRGRYTEQTRDEMGNLISDFSSADNTTVRYEYNGFGELIQTTDPRGLIHRQDVDGYGRPIRSYHTGTSVGELVAKAVPTYYPGYPDMVKSSGIYSPTGELAATYETVFDGEGRPVGLKVNGVQQESNTYDLGANSVGRLTTAETPDAKTTYGYDGMGRVTQIATTVTKGGLNRSIITGQAYDVINGNIESTQFGDGTAIQYVYSPTTQQVSQVKCQNAPMISYSYNPNGTIQKMTLGNGFVVSYLYEKEILLKGISVTNTANILIYNQTYSYDAQGLMSNTAHSDHMYNRSNVKREYVYSLTDELSQTKVTVSPVDGQAVTQFQYDYEFDANGNPLKFETPRMRNVEAANFVIDSKADKVLVRKNPELNQEERFTYDGEGNVTKRELYNLVTTQKMKTTEYTYNYQGQITSIKIDGQVVGSYGYDHQRQRIYREVPSTNTTVMYQWDGAGRVIGEWETSKATATVKYVYSGNEKVAMVRPDASGAEQIYYFINNAQGTPVLIIGQTGNVVAKINLDEWGNRNPGQYIDTQEINYTGKKLDPESGLYYFNQRYYDPSMGRFLTEDPAKQAYNPYLYSANNPVMYVDPDGEFWWVVAGAVIGAVVANWGKPVTFENTIKGAVIGATIAATGGAAMGMETMAVNWAAVAEVGGISAGIGGSLGMLGGMSPMSSNIPRNIDMPSQISLPPLDYSLPDASTWGSEVVIDSADSISPSVVYRSGVRVTSFMADKLDELSVKLNGQTVIVNSGIRTQEAQDRIRSNPRNVAARISQHTVGHAADIALAGIPNSEAARMVYRTGIFNRVNLYKRTPQGIHVDFMKTSRRIYLEDWEIPQ